jgi:cytochrome c oxidase subunit 1
VFIGFTVTFIPQFVMGSQGMPRRYHEYLPQFEIYHQLSTVGSYIMAAGLFLAAYVFLACITKGKPAGDNPWGAKSMEWETKSPPIEHNFHGQPVCKHGPYDFDEIDHAAATGHH